ncbi:hypothetical protein [Streptomyces sp. NPDC059862]|uniref:hypothetical protein n=1 Tax=unclassified Streptomyces TaxID=2593676 RepID=UPI00362F8770
MAKEELLDHSSSGRLLAALWTLRLLAQSDETPPERDELLAKKQPSESLGKLLPSMANHLMRARKLGGDRWKAAVEVFRDIPDLLPAGQVPDKTMSPDKQRAFADGYDEQRSKYAEKFGRLLGA